MIYQNRHFSNLNPTKLEKHNKSPIPQISKKDSGNSSTLSISRDFRTIKKMLDDPRFSRIILPIQQNTTVTLPVGPGPQRDHQAFPHHLVTITSLKDEVLVLNSLQRPKKITIVGSNGLFSSCFDENTFHFVLEISILV